MRSKEVFFIIAILFVANSLNGQVKDSAYHEPFRPQFHFSPKAHWMNDPNGMVYYKGVYNLFFQYYPNGTTWGPMHWGHAISKDLIHWKENPIALFPDSLGYIFSGSAVVDVKNTSGLGKAENPALVAIFTSHDPVGERQRRNNYQTQSLAYSLDGGQSWTKYQKNPVLANPGITDFRDPKVMWFEPTKKWIMTLATKDCVTFYSSPDLKQWSKESQFGQTVGGHGGVWECPDLFPLQIGNKKLWVLVVSVNPGGPNGGSASQYFVGDFDGNKFVANDSDTKWVDFGTDNYAGVTWSNTGDRKIYLGWMSNWQYANKVPTKIWRSAMTIPRTLSLVDVQGKYFLASNPVKELEGLTKSRKSLKKIKIESEFDLSDKLGRIDSLYQIKLSAKKIEDFSFVLSNDKGEELKIGYDKKQNQYYIDRTRAGINNFDNQFGKIFSGPRISINKGIELTLFLDVASAELFCDGGLTAMTGIFFPTAPYNKLVIRSNGLLIDKLTYSKINSIF